MNPSIFALIGTIVGPSLLFASYLLSRKHTNRSFMSDLMKSQIDSALATTETMRSLLEPLEKEISDLRKEVVTLRQHIAILEEKIIELGHQPPDPPHFAY